MPRRSAGECEKPHRSLKAGGKGPAVGLIREVDYDLDPVEMSRPVGPWADVANRPELDARHRFRRRPGASEDGVTALDQPAAQGTADEAGGTGHQNARQAHPFATSLRADSTSDL